MATAVPSIQLIPSDGSESRYTVLEELAAAGKHLLMKYYNQNKNISRKINVTVTQSHKYVTWCQCSSDQMMHSGFFGRTDKSSAN